MSSNSLKVKSSARPLIFAVYELSSMTTSPVRISRADGSLANFSASMRPMARRIRASSSAGPAVSRMTSSIPQSALIAERAPSVAIATIGQSRPVVVNNFASAFAAGNSLRASRKMQSTSGTSTSTDASAGRMRTWCCKSPRLGITSALAPRVFVRRRILAISGRIPSMAKLAPLISPSEMGAEFGSRATLLQFSSAFCTPCRATRTLLVDITSGMSDVVHVDLDAESHLELVRRLNIISTPTTLILNHQGIEVGRAVGAPKRAQVVAALAAIS